MITLLTGENTYQNRLVRVQTIAKFRESHTLDAVTVVDGTVLSKDDLPQLLMGTNLFAPERYIVIDDAHAQKIIWEALGEYLSQVSDTTDVLLVAAGADKRTKTYKWLQKHADVRESKALDERALANWLQAESRTVGASLTPELARYIVEYVGFDQERLKHDIEKLRLSGQLLTRELIRDVLIPSPQASAFELLDATMSGDNEVVERLLEGVRMHEDPYRFFGLLANQAYALMIVASAGTRPADEVARASGLHPFVVRKMGSVARRVNATKRNQLVEVVAQLDVQMKSSGVDPWTLITAALKNIAA